MAKTKRLALLVCDTPIPAVRSTHGAYSEIFTTLFRASLPPGADFDFTLDPYDVVDKQEYPPEAEAYDAIVITGSVASAYTDIEWINNLVAYVASITEHKPELKIIGICFGHQIVGRALGGECVSNDGKWEVGVTPIDLTELGKEIFGVDSLNIQQMHRDHVPYVPPAFHLLGSTPVSPVQGMVRFYPTQHSGEDTSSLKHIQIFTVQGHPEFDERIMDALVETRSSTGILDQAVAADARRRAAWRNDGVSVVGKAIWKVLGVGE